MHSGVETLRSISEIEEIREFWMRMQWHPNSDIDFYQAVLKCLSSVVRPHVLVLWRDGVPQAILVGRLEDSRLNIHFGYSTIAGPANKTLVFVYGGVLGEPSSAECGLIMRTILGSLRAGEADRVFFNHLRTDCALYDAVLHVPQFFSRDYCTPGQMHRALTLPASFDDLRRSFTQRVRSNLRWEANRILKAHGGNVRIQCFARPEELEHMIQDCEKVAAQTYQRGLGAGFRDSPLDRALVQWKADKGWLRSYILYIQDQPRAFWSGTLYRGTLHSDHMAYDPAYRKYAPGKYLMMRTIEAFCEQKGQCEVEIIDFGLGDAEYKRMLCDRTWLDASPSVFAPNLRGIALNAYRTPLMQLDLIGRRLLSSSLEARVKRAWRNRVAGREIES